MLDGAKVQLADSVGNLYDNSNPIDVINAPSTDHFFTKQTAASTALTPQLAFGFTSRHIKIVNDGTPNISFSFNGSTVQGIAKPNEILNFEDKAHTQIYIAAITTTGGTYRVWAW